MKGRAICGYQQSNNHNLEKPIKLIKSDVAIFTEKVDKQSRYSYSYRKKKIAERVFERGYKEYLKSLKK